MFDAGLPAARAVMKVCSLPGSNAVCGAADIPVAPSPNGGFSRDSAWRSFRILPT
jgi:hypothetical protein